MAGYKWQKIDTNPIQYPPSFLEPEDHCFFAREYTPGAGFAESETNDLINNFKKPPDRKGKPEWYYKEKAIERFASELSSLLQQEHVVTCVPSSKIRSHPLYDSRLEDTLNLLQKNNTKIYLEFPLIRSKSITAKHEGGIRNPSIEKASLSWVGLKKEYGNIIIVDDIITSGASFKACQKMILENIPDIEVIGVFWARAISK